DEHVLGAVLAQAVEDLGHERHVGAREDGDADGIGVLLQRRLDDLLGRLVQPGVDDLQAGVSQGTSDDLRAAVVPVESRLGDDNSYVARHRGEYTDAFPTSVAAGTRDTRDTPHRDGSRST